MCTVPVSGPAVGEVSVGAVLVTVKETLAALVLHSPCRVQSRAVSVCVPLLWPHDAQDVVTAPALTATGAPTATPSTLNCTARALEFALSVTTPLVSADATGAVMVGVVTGVR